MSYCITTPEKDIASSAIFRFIVDSCEEEQEIISDYDYKVHFEEGEETIPSVVEAHRQQFHTETESWEGKSSLSMMRGAALIVRAANEASLQKIEEAIAVLKAELTALEVILRTNKEMIM